LEKDRTKIIIPTPALSEFLVHAGNAGPAYLESINSSSSFKVAPFDQRSAIELAAMTKEAIQNGDKRGRSNETWAKVKFDRQIVAIAKIEGARVIYSDDNGLKNVASENGITVIRISEMALPPEPPQIALAFDQESD